MSMESEAIMKEYVSLVSKGKTLKAISIAVQSMCFVVDSSDEPLAAKDEAIDLICDLAKVKIRRYHETTNQKDGT